MGNTYNLKSSQCTRRKVSLYLSFHCSPPTLSWGVKYIQMHCHLMLPTRFSLSEIPKNHLSNRQFLSVEVCCAPCTLVSLPVCLWAIISLLLPLTGLLQFKLCFYRRANGSLPIAWSFPYSFSGRFDVLRRQRRKNLPKLCQVPSTQSYVIHLNRSILRRVTHQKLGRW